MTIKIYCKYFVVHKMCVLMKFTPSKRRTRNGFGGVTESDTKTADVCEEAFERSG